jgi:hypothetical protein
MNRPILTCALLLLCASGLGAQQTSATSPYQGTSTPPADDAIVTTSTPQPKPSPAVPAEQQPAAVPDPAQSPAVSSVPSATATDPDSGIVAVAQPTTAESEPTLKQRATGPDPDGDIVRMAPPRPGELPEGATIRVELLDRLSTISSEKGEAFRSRVASDVVEGGQVLIPAGAEIDGHLASVSSGHPGGHGSMLLRPETLILADGTRFQLHASLSGTPGAKSRVKSEGAVVPGSRLKRDSIEYGGVVGAGATTGAVIGGPVGALTGGLIGAGVVTAHLLIRHPQATLESGTVLLFTLSEPLQLSPGGVSGN